MSIQASEAFGLFLTALRNSGVDIPLNDKAVAEMLSDLLPNCGTGITEEETTLENLALEFGFMVEQGSLASDNGSDY